MPFRIRDKMEFWSAAIFILFGVAFLAISPNYEFGNPVPESAPVFFPPSLASC